MPGTRPMRRTIMCRRLLPVNIFTALPMVVLSRLSPFTSVILSPTHRPARSAPEDGGGWHGALGERVSRVTLSLPHQPGLSGVKTELPQSESGQCPSPGPWIVGLHGGTKVR
uniref:Uncharacterized protein n=1 Tax=Prolemur simus TaxID=1328070 RepID=A0A8C8ZFH6_PROSS